MMSLVIAAVLLFVVEFLLSLRYSIPTWIGEGPNRKFSETWARKVHAIWRKKIHPLADVFLVFELLAVLLLAIAQAFVTPEVWTTSGAVVFFASAIGRFLGEKIDRPLEHLWRATLKV